jgi:hypothetical protein
VFRRVLRKSPFIALLVAAAMLGIAASASAAQLVTNGDFETGTLEGWTSADQGEELAAWAVTSRKKVEEHPIFYGPSSGEYFAYGFAPFGRDTFYLYQDVTLPAATTDQLSMYLSYISAAPFAEPTPNTLVASAAEKAQPNQQIRVDVLKSNAPLESLSPNDLLTTVYATKAGDPLEHEPTLVSADLSAFAGQTVRLRIAAVAQDAGVQIGVDGVSIDSNPIPPLPPPPAPTYSPPSNAFTIGHLFRDRKHGAAKLDVTLPGPGFLTVADARRGVAVASARPIPKEPPVFIRTTSAQTSGPQTVRVFLRPTAAAKKILGKRGKLPIRLQLTFTPEGGMTATQGYEGTLRKVLRPARR